MTQRYGEPFPQLLERLYIHDRMSTPQIAERLGLKSGSARVYRLLKRYSIPIREASERISMSWEGSDNPRREAQSEWMRAVRHSDAFLNRTESLANRHRSQPTRGERLMQSALEALGIRFAFQEQIGPFIVDFLLADLDCVLEVDTKHHTIPKIADRDVEKDRYLRSSGLGVIRVFVAPHCDEAQAQTDLEGALKSFGLHS